MPVKHIRWFSLFVIIVLSSGPLPNPPVSGLARTGVQYESAPNPTTAPTAAPADCMALDSKDNSGTSRAWCLFQALVDQTSGPKWLHWIAVPKGGVNDLDCSGPNAGSANTQTENSRLMRITNPRAKAANQDGENLMRALRDPKQLDVTTPPSPDTRSATPSSQYTEYAAVHFNSTLAQYICSFRKSDSSLTDTLTSMATASKQAIDAPRDSTIHPIMVKTIWALVQAGTASEIPIWDPSNDARQRDMQMPPSETHITSATAASDSQTLASIGDWQTKAILDASSKGARDVCSDDGQRWTGAPTPKLTIGCFLAFPVSQDQRVEIGEHVAGKIVPQIPGSVISNSGYYLILLGFHIVAKGSEGWTWQTFWWSRYPKSDSLATSANNPYQEIPKWSHFVVAASGTNNPQSKTLTNPYLEATVVNGLKSNCIVCHSYAFFHPKPKAPNPKNVNSPDCFFSYELYQAMGVPASLSCVHQATAPKAIFSDFIWSVADSNVPNAVPSDSGGPGMPR